MRLFGRSGKDTPQEYEKAKEVINEMYNIGHSLGELLLEGIDAYSDAHEENPQVLEEFLLQALGGEEINPENLNFALGYLKERVEKWMGKVGAVPPTGVYALMRDYLHKRAQSWVYLIHQLTLQKLQSEGHKIEVESIIPELIRFESAILSHLANYNPQNPNYKILRKAIDAGKKVNEETEVLYKIGGLISEVDALRQGVDSATKTQDETMKVILKNAKEILEQYRSYLETLFKHRSLFI